MLSEGPNDPGTMASDSSYGDVDWTNPDNAKTSNNSYAEASGVAKSTYYLKATNFGFSILPGYCIVGIKVEVEAKKSVGPAARDIRVRIVKADGSIGTTDKAKSQALTTTDTYYEYGGSGDVWGESWTPAEINDSDFGVVIAYEVDDGTVYVDHIHITVYYSQFIFRDGFQTGDYSRWTGALISANNICVVESLHPYHGSYNLKAVRTTTGAANVAEVYKTFNEMSTIFARFYLQMGQLPAVGDGWNFAYLRPVLDTSAWRCLCGIKNDAGTLKWKLTYKHAGATTHVYSTTPTPQVGKWFCLEMKWVKSTTVGEARLWVNGDEVCTATGKNTGTDDIVRFEMGTISSNVGYDLINYEDCAVVACSYIGLKTKDFIWVLKGRGGNGRSKMRFKGSLHPRARG